MIVNLNLGHYAEMERLHEEDKFPLPDPNSKLYFDQRALLSESGKLQAVGFLKLTSEATLIIDRNLPSFTRAKIIKELLFQLIQDLDAVGLEDSHVFVEPDNERMISFLLESSFRKISQVPLYLPPVQKGNTNG